MYGSVDQARFRSAVVGELTRLRRSARMSQSALAFELGIDQSIVSRIEAGTRYLTIEEVFAWAEALGQSSDAISGFLVAAWEKHAARGRGYWE